MNPAPDDIVNEARTWLETPWHHQGRLKGVGVDCVGLLVGVGRAVGLEIEDSANYRRNPARPLLRAALSAHLVEIELDAAGPGDVLLFDYAERGGEIHCAIVTELDPMSMVHALEGHGVMEHGLGSTWRRRLSAAFKVPGIE